LLISTRIVFLQFKQSPVDMADDRVEPTCASKCRLHPASVITHVKIPPNHQGPEFATGPHSPYGNIVVSQSRRGSVAILRAGPGTT